MEAKSGMEARSTDASWSDAGPSENVSLLKVKNAVERSDIVRSTRPQCAPLSDVRLSNTDRVTCRPSAWTPEPSAPCQRHRLYGCLMALHQTQTGRAQQPIAKPPSQIGLTATTSASSARASYSLRP
jgi:hypothetical protein